MKKKTIAFVFFGQNRVEDFVQTQLDEIRKAEEKYRMQLDFHILDATRDGIKTKINIQRVNLFKVNKIKPNRDLDPLSSYRNSGKNSKISGGMSKATTYYPVIDYLEFINSEQNFDFIFRLRTDVLVNEKLIDQALDNVIPLLKRSPYSLLKHKVWAQFFHLIVPFYIHDTAFLISSEDLYLIAKEALNNCDFYPSYANPSCFWGPLFYKRFPYLLNLAYKFISEIQEKPSLSFNDIKLLPIYWKIIFTNFYISFNPKVKFIGQWNLNKLETRLWKNISRNDCVKLSLMQLRFIFKNFDCLYFEHNIESWMIYKISTNSNFNFQGNIIVIKIFFKTLINKIFKLFGKSFFN